LPAARSSITSVDGAILIVGLVIGEAIDERGIAPCIRLGDRRFPQRARGSDLEQLSGNLADALLHPRPAPLPCLAAQPV
jgi:hypothetical protein